jgi:hypothetical protein
MDSEVNGTVQPNTKLLNGTMAELVDATDSKSVSFGSVGSIPSGATILGHTTRLVSSGFNHT